MSLHSGRWEFILTLDEAMAKKLAIRALQRGVRSMEFIDMLLIIIYLALLRISSDSKCCAKAVSVEYRHNPFILFHVSWISFFIYILLCSWLHLCLVFFPIFRAFSEAMGGRSLRPAPKRFPPLARLANDIEKNANESTIHNNNTAERTKYDQATIMTRFTRKSNSTEEDVTGFSSPYLCSCVVLNSGLPVQKSKFGACAVTGYWSLNGQENVSIRYT